jgi:hypothetical protein
LLIVVETCKKFARCHLIVWPSAKLRPHSKLKWKTFDEVHLLLLLLAKINYDLLWTNKIIANFLILKYKILSNKTHQGTGIIWMEQAFIL